MAAARVAGRYAVRAGTRYVLNKYTRRRVKGRYGVGTTNQYDRTNVYRKKRMPRRKRKRWTSFVKKVKAAENTTLGTRTRVLNTQHQFSESSASGSTKKQLFRSLGLYTLHSESNEWNNDLHNIMLDQDIKASGKIQMISGVMDMTLVNTSVDSNNQPMGIELDVYMCTARKLFTYMNTADQYVYSDLAQALNDAALTSTLVPGIGQKIDASDRGVTPFDLTLGLSSFGVKILNKKKYFLPNGNQMTYQIRDPKNRQFSKDQILNEKGQNKPGSTKILLLVAKGLPGAAVDGNDYKVRLDVGITRKYAYKLNEDDSDKTGTN